MLRLALKLSNAIKLPDGIKLPFPRKRKNEHPLRGLFQKLHLHPGDVALYELAMRHSSNSIIDPKTGHRINNERLEFLGDSILSAVVCYRLYLLYPSWDEGDLSKRKGSIVARTVNNRVGQQLQLHKYISAKQDLRKMSPDILGNAVEALIGAIFLDKGFKAAEQFVCSFIFPVYLRLEENTDFDIINYKSQLIEWAQKHHFELEFVQQSALPKQPNLFRYTVEINHQVVGQGVGSSKKKAHQEAAFDAINKLQKAQDALLAAQEENDSPPQSP